MIGNAQRPLLSYGVKNDRSTRRTLLYVEALTRFEKEASELDLTDAYARARPSFKGKLERTFLILKDNPGEAEELASGANAVPLKK